MTNQSKINHVITTFPILANHVDMVEFILEIRETFNLEKVPFEVKVGNWTSGSLKPYYKQKALERKAERLSKKKPKQKRPLNQPYTKFR